MIPVSLVRATRGIKESYSMIILVGMVTISLTYIWAELGRFDLNFDTDKIIEEAEPSLALPFYFLFPLADCINTKHHWL